MSEEIIDEKEKSESIPVVREPQKEIPSDVKCPQCGELFPTREEMMSHNKDTHDIINNYICKQCDYKTSAPNNLRYHVETKHSGIRYPCDQCSHQALTKGNLKQHVLVSHEGLRFACSHCQYESRSKPTLNRHCKSKHPEIDQ